VSFLLPRRGRKEAESAKHLEKDTSSRNPVTSAHFPTLAGIILAPMDRPSLSDEQRSQLNCISRDIVSAAIKVHTLLGPGLLESADEACLVHELRRREQKVLRQVGMPVMFQGIALEVGYRMDLLVDDVICG
jgi:PD-(D/E)XK nuclease superfamily